MHRLVLATILVPVVMSACGPAPNAPSTQPTPTAIAVATPALPTSTPAPIATPVVGFTPQTSQRGSSGAPLPFAPNSVSVVVTYTPVPTGALPAKSGLVSVSIGDNYFDPEQLRVTVGSTVEWNYDGGGGETESIHNVIGPSNTFSSGDLNPGSRFAYTFKQIGEFDYLCTYHAKQMTARVVVVQ